MTSVKTHLLTLGLTYVFFSTSVNTTFNADQFIAGYDKLKHIIADESDFSKCFSLVLRQNVPCHAFVSFIYSASDVSDIKELLSKDKCHSIIIRTFRPKKWLFWIEFYVIIAENFTELLTGLWEMRSDLLWNPGAKFIIAMENTNGVEVIEIFNTFIKLKMFNVLFLNRIEDKNTLIYTYYPFRNGNCGVNADAIVNLGNCLDNENPKRIPINNISESRNCELKAVLFEEKPHKIIPGKPDVIIPTVEQYVLATYAKYSNFTVDYNVIKTEKDYGIVYPNGTIAGLLHYLYVNTGDIAVGSTVIIMNRASMFDFIHGFNYASFKLYTSALGSEMWKKVYEEFNLETYLIILSFYCLMVIVCIIFLNKEPKIPHSRIYLVMKLWAFFYLGNGTEPYPKTKRLRSVTICWIWFTFFISSFYNSYMYSLITGHVQRVRHIEPNKLNSIPYKPCIPKVMRTFFRYAYNEDLPESFDTDACHSIDGALDTTANGLDLFTVQMKPSYTEREIEFIDENGNRKLESWDFGSDILLGFYLARGFPFKKKLQVFAQYMYETGLVDNYKQNMKPPTGAIPRRKAGLSRPFVIDDFKVHYAVLFIGIIISTLTFIAEIIYTRKAKHGSFKLT